METIYDYLYNFITSYFLPPGNETVGEIWTEAVMIFAAVLSAILFYQVCIRPFVWLLKYGIIGGSKRSNAFNIEDEPAPFKRKKRQ